MGASLSPTTFPAADSRAGADHAVLRRRPPPVVVLNPNSTQAVTEALSAALEPMRLPGGPAIECGTLAGAPAGIESDADVAEVIEPICDYFRTREGEASAFVIACFSDPGIDSARRAVGRPVFGMAESGYLTALCRGGRFGVISILPEAVVRHRRHIERIGIGARLAADLPVGLGVTELADEECAWPRIRAVGQALREEHRADVLLLGCAGMAPYRRRLEEALGVPVVDPVQAAVTLALGAVLAA